MDSKLTLFQLNTMVREAMNDSFPLTYWVIAEISDIKVNKTGHCYLELIESDEVTKEISAKARAVIWSKTYRMIKPYFEVATGRDLQSGMKVLVNASIDFHELFGFSLNIRDIDPTYTIGDIEQQRKDIILRLKREGIIEMNKEIPLLYPIQKIAVISSETAAGFEDFADQLINNSSGIKFYFKLFHAIMQGAMAEPSIMEALDRIYNYESFFDCVVIIRGGGSKSDLSCFDSYNLAYYITQFPLPVITGIGHEKDDSIVDIVAHTRLKTPTAVAGFIIEKAVEADDYISDLAASLQDMVTDIIQHETTRVDQATMKFIPLVKRSIDKRKNNLLILAGKFQNAGNQYIRNRKGQLEIIGSKLSSRLENSFRLKSQTLSYNSKILIIKKNRFLLKKHHELEMFENSNEHLNPEGILKRGYSLTFKDGDLLKSVKTVRKGDIISTRLADGNIKSVISD